jgi:hypothetical protein
MALINCPECGKEISDKALSCPSCGCPMQPTMSDLENNNKTKSKSERNAKNRKLYVIVGAILTILCVVLFFAGITVVDKSRLDSAESAVVKIVCYDYSGNEIATGSGFFYEDDINIVTNYHVIEDAYSAKIITNDDVSFDVSQVVYASKEMDLAVVRLKEFSGYPYLESGAMSYVKKGNEIYAIGSPLGIKNTLSTGIISGRHMVEGVETIQFTAPISSGSSGGALLDKQGKVIGVTFASYDDGQNINLAIPINLVNELCESESLYITLPQLNKEKYLHAREIEKLKIIEDDILQVDFDEYRNNLSKYLGEMVMFEGYISSKDETGDSEDTYKYYVTNYDNVSGNLEHDILSWGAEVNSPYLLVSCYHSWANRECEFEVGEKVKVVTVAMEEAEKMFYVGYIVYNEEKSFSVVNYILEQVLDEESYKKVIAYD